ncbi:hypothetical protein [Krasilnikovia sp. M28-CT-15]|uniref:hypothetical protein n=1 Tax=Krasilnikovia sp. M28-CT-15 TaxID=3373540 RepID=UPI0038762DE7
MTAAHPPALAKEESVNFRAFPAVLLLVGVSVGACTSGSGGEAAPKPLHLPPGTTQAFEMINFKAYDAVGASIWRYQKECASKRGYHVTEQATHDIGSSLIQTPSMMGDATEEAARRNGLHDGPTDDPGGSKQRPSRGESEALGACFTEAQDRLGADTQQKRENFIALVNDVSSAFYAEFRTFQDGLFVEANHCVADAGWKPTDVGKLDDPSISPATLFGVQTATPVARPDGRTLYNPLPREIDLAIEFAKCRREKGMPDRAVAQAIKLEEPIVSKYEQRIVEMNHEIDDLAKRAAEVLS